MRGRIYVASVLVTFFATAMLLTFEGAIALFFGWIIFLWQVVPGVSVNWPTLLLGIGALVVFAVSLHLAGRSILWRFTKEAKTNSRNWRGSWTISLIAAVLVLFAAGISLVGVVHQVSWLANADSPMMVQAIVKQSTPESDLKLLGLALANYDPPFGKLPAGGTFAADGRMLHSWETSVLPFAGYYSGGVDMERPWNDPVNQRYFKCILPIYINSSLRGAPLEDDQGYGFSHYAANSWVMGGNRSMKLADIKGGISNTLLIGEVNAGFKPWGHPVNWRDPVLGINSSPQGFGGASGSGGAMFVMADGSVRFLKESISPEALRALSKPCGGEAVGPGGRKE
jgi:hypothetical protein